MAWNSFLGFIYAKCVAKKLDFSINQNEIFIAVSGYIVLLSAWYAFLVIFSKGPVFLLSVLLITWTADIGAYFVGKKYGKYKLAPQISPGKSIEGAIGGILAVCLLGICFYNYNTSLNDFFSMLGSKYSVFALLLVSVCLAVMSILGDLFESQLKRLSGMKDSSNLLPGHGGILDRLDAVLPVLPISAMIVLELF
jgi:phosphatidate cytidylyltransferase